MQDRAHIERVGEFLIIRTGSGEDLVLRAIRASQITRMEQRRMLTGPDASSSRPSVLLHLLDGESMWLLGWTMEELVFFLSIRGPEQESPRVRKEEEAWEWQEKLVGYALNAASPEIREAAIEAAETWDNPRVASALRNHVESVAWLKEYSANVLSELSEEADAVVTEALRADGLLSDKTVSLQGLGKREVLQGLVAACYYQLGVVHLELTEPAPAHEFSWETAQRGERRQGKLDSISSVLLAAEQALRELG